MAYSHPNWDRVLVTGGTGFVGSNLAAGLAGAGARVVVFDNLSRAGVRRNAEWLQAQFPDTIELRTGDIRDPDSVRRAAEGVGRIFHLAGQVAVTTSVKNPREDFEINALGTLNVLEAARTHPQPPAVFFTSTNKVYGGMEDVVVVERGNRYEYRDYPEGMDESRPLDFHSPYGCSKGAADQYVRDYARIYGFPTVVFRMSCIYGRRQFGNEDQGWVAHFIRAAAAGQPLTVYGDGKQIRDILFVDDLVRAFQMASAALDTTGGQVYNIGGGARNTISLLELLALIEALLGHPVPATFGDWRPGDQRVYVSNAARARADFGWAPQVDREQGIRLLHEWIVAETRK